MLLQQIYTKPQINNILNNYISKVEFEPSKPVKKRKEVKIETYEEEDNPIPSKPKSSDEDDDYASFTM